ncbi:M91 family zinc metallopeptidase [Legionella spiritensis]|uniref:M91 family zinc metallopeptidase n=1 Tax=Legionella spiritensis TaxID=452 RepID=UPI000F718796|nr:M91 family zinc metallopeptidase [Legionella spiritensis]VEG91128.1 Uncharacterised protein [Legionella spiritensis]
MKEKIEAIARPLSKLDIAVLETSHQEEEEHHDQLAARIDHLSHAAYQEIEALYSRFNPEANKEEQLLFFKRILAIKNKLRELQLVHNDLAKTMYENNQLYLHQEIDISSVNKYISDELKGRETKEIIQQNFHQLLINISKNNTFSDDEFRYINSLLMQIAARPEGQKLILKLNYLLTSKNAQLVVKNSKDFSCSMTRGGTASVNPDYQSVSRKDKFQEDYQSVFKKATLKGEGSQRVLVGFDGSFNKTISSLNLDVYASKNQGLTDMGPAFILLAHELIHAIHNLDGSARHNFAPFFQTRHYQDDPFMKLLYPTSSLYSFGASAEEYWTIEGGKLCENSIRTENGFGLRTGHLSTEPGSQGIRDLYYIGLAKSNTKSNLDKYSNYLQELENKNDQEIVVQTMDDKTVEKSLKIEKLKMIRYSPDDIITLCKSLKNFHLKRTSNALEKLPQSSRIILDNNADVDDFLMILPPKVLQIILAVDSWCSDTKNPQTIESISEWDIDRHDLDAMLPKLKTLNEIFTKSVVDLGPLGHHLSQFIERLETKGQSHHYNM